MHEQTHPVPAPTNAAAAAEDLAALLAAASRGDQRAWKTIVDLYARRVYALARSRIGSRRSPPPGAGGAGPWGRGDELAEEVTQSVFVTVAAKLTRGEYTELGRFEPWLFRVAMNRIRDEVRRTGRQAHPTDPEAFEAIAGPSRPFYGDPDSAEGLRSLREALGQLSDADREVIELRHHANLPFKQIAELLDEPIGTLLARHHRALRKLKEILTAGTPSLEHAGDTP